MFRQCYLAASDCRMKWGKHDENRMLFAITSAHNLMLYELVTRMCIKSAILNY